MKHRVHSECTESGRARQVTLLGPIRCSTENNPTQRGNTFSGSRMLQFKVAQIQKHFFSFFVLNMTSVPVGSMHSVFAGLALTAA